MRRRVLRALIVSFALLVAAGIGVALWARAELRASLPLLDGSRQLAGLTAPVVITRDELGIPTIRGRSRADVARATGFLHAQDRFFQMDLSRRRAAGELSALVGARALALDREIRVHRFRAEAVRALSSMAPGDRAILDAYTAGVNSGLAALGARPFEYLLLRQPPLPWRAEDSLLVVLSMFVTLQDSDGSYESTLATMHDVLPREMYEFLAPRGTEWDAPIVGEAFSTPPIPAASVYNLRERRRGKPGINLGIRREVVQNGTESPTLGLWPEALGVQEADHEALGSNNWAVAGQLTSDGGALVANDMHLSVRVPNTWYRAALEWDGSEPSTPHRVIGVTLPGVPAVVVGSNTNVAWGFTNTYADWGDLVLLEVDSQHPNRYRTPNGWKEFEQHDETIEIAGQPPQHVPISWSMWGPVLGPDHAGRQRAYRWVAHSADRLASSITPIEGARTLEEALDEANGIGTPGQNFVVADRSGRIAWSVYGAIPRRAGIDGTLPASWADGGHGWTGWLDDAEYPRIVDPPSGRIWTANARVIDGDMLARLGDGSFEVGSRAGMIRERLMAKERFTVRDMLDIQLDTRAVFLSRWRDLLLQTLTPAATANSDDRREFRRIVETTWDGRASAGSASYRLTRLFREQASERVMGFALAECYEADPTFDYRTVRRREGPIWKLVSEKPAHLLDPRYESWEQLLLASVDAVIAISKQGGHLADPWSRYNVTSYRHPLSASVPFFGRWLDMPDRALPGDLYTPRMHWGNNAASERMVVSPGREAEGIMQMPTGQSGHPLSPFYANSHEAWVNGTPTPFLPGPAAYTLTLNP